MLFSGRNERESIIRGCTSPPIMLQDIPVEAMPLWNVRPGSNWRRPFVKVVA